VIASAIVRKDHGLMLLITLLYSDILGATSTAGN